MEDDKLFDIKDEDGEVVGQVRRVHDDVYGWMWRAWIFRGDPEDGWVDTKLSLHDIPDDAETEIEKYWGMVR